MSFLGLGMLGLTELFRRLRALRLIGMSLDNLSRLTGFESLQSIDFSATKVSDLALLAAPKALRQSIALIRR
jgi:hypothetical protein